ncbi:MAG: hypothetical protein ACI9UA_000020 [Pseudoalteromonas tetraodonis]|jgi:hypothetical protein
MRRGCIITIMVISAIVLVTSILMFTLFWPKFKQTGTSTFAYVLEDGLEQYLADEKAYPPATDNAGIVKFLWGENPREKKYVQDLDSYIKDGQITDFWENPFEFQMPAAGTEEKPIVTSAGPNGIHGDEDDIGSHVIRSKFESGKQ